MWVSKSHIRYLITMSETAAVCNEERHVDSETAIEEGKLTRDTFYISINISTTY